MQLAQHNFIMRSGLSIVFMFSLGVVGPVAAQSSEEFRSSREAGYKVFVQRNPFGLRDPTPPVAPKPPPAPPQNKTYLTGITALPPNKPRLTAHFKRVDPANKSTEFSLKVGEGKDGLEVVSIELDPVESKVRVQEDGVEAVYTFANHGVKPPRATAAAAPGQPVSLPGIRAGVPSAQVINASLPNPGMVINPATGQLSAPSAVPSAPTVRTLNPRAGAGASLPQPNVAMQYSTVSGGAPSKSVSIPLPAAQGVPAPNSAVPPAVSVISGSYPDPQHIDSGMNSAQQQFLMEINRVSNPTLPPTPGIPAPSLPGGGAQ